LKLNGLPIDHLNTGVTGPFGWITRGTIDIDLHFLFPQTNDDDILDRILDEIDEIRDVALDKLKKAAVTSRDDHQEVSKKPLRIKLRDVRHYGLQYPRRREQEPPNTAGDVSDVVMYWRIKLNDAKASVPLTTPHISYLNNALIRPIVGYMNANHTSIPLSFRAKMDLVT
jgi:mitochondrial distribution and morphology protein 31